MSIWPFILCAILAGMLFLSPKIQEAYVNRDRSKMYLTLCLLLVLTIAYTVVLFLGIFSEW